jgi:hypothetical protein
LRARDVERLESALTPLYDTALWRRRIQRSDAALRYSALKPLYVPVTTPLHAYTHTGIRTCNNRSIRIRGNLSRRMRMLPHTLPEGAIRSWTSGPHPAICRPSPHSHAAAPKKKNDNKKLHKKVPNTPTTLIEHVRAHAGICLATASVLVLRAATPWCWCWCVVVLTS